MSLPKGAEKITYTDDLRQAIVADKEIRGKAFSAIMKHLNAAPTVDAVEVVHGRWEWLLIADILKQTVTLWKWCGVRIAYITKTDVAHIAKITMIPDIDRIISVLTIKQARSLLPSVGDKRMERISGKDSVEQLPPQKCVVVEVNPERLWYRVRFEAGFCERYKVPRGKQIKLGDMPW